MTRIRSGRGVPLSHCSSAFAEDVALELDWDLLHQRADDLPTHACVACAIMDSIEAGEWGEPLESCLLQDPAISMKILRLANSAVFGKPGRIATLSHATALLEPHVTRLVGLSFRVLLPPPTGLFSYEHFWRDSVLCSTTAERIAPHFPEVNVDEARITALVMNIGELVLAEALGDTYSQAHPGDTPSRNVEYQARGTERVDPLLVTARLLGDWNISSAIVQAVHAQTDPSTIESLAEHPRELAKVLYLCRSAVEHVLHPSSPTTAKLAQFRHWAKVDAALIDELLSCVASDRATIESLLQSGASQQRAADRARKAILNISLSTARRLSDQSKQAEQHERKVHDLRRQRDRLKQQVMTDPLLGIGNRRYFDARLAEELKRSCRHGQPLSLILFDIDHFKRLNDTFSHPAGDEVLQSTTRTLSNFLRSSDIFCRYGGEEFAVICPETDSTGAVRLAERMRHCLERLEIYYCTRAIQTTASFGVATLEEAAEQTVSPQGLLEAADLHLFEAKKAGRNCVRFGFYPPAPHANV